MIKKQVKLIAVNYDTKKLHVGQYLMFNKTLLKASEMDVEYYVGRIPEKLQPVKLYLISDDKPQEMDTVYVPSTNKFSKVIRVHVTEKKVYEDYSFGGDYFYDIRNEIGTTTNVPSDTIKKVITGPDNIGFQPFGLVVQGTTKGEFIGVVNIKISTLQGIMHNGGNCYIEMEKDNELKYIANKIMIHLKND